MSADLVFINGKVLTMNPAQPIAEAVAIKGDKIFKVGPNEEINQLIGNSTKIIQLNGKTVLPGFIDTHIHVADFGRLLAWVDLTNANSIEEIKSSVKERAEKTPKGRWILGRGWNEGRFKDKRLPNRSDLDEVSPNNPVILYHEKAQVCLVNSTALELANITAQTKTPQGGTIDKNAKTGEPKGILRDNATNLVWQKIPEPDEEELLEATALACEKIVEAGVTSVHWMVLSPIEISIAQKLQAQKRLPIRVNLIIPTDLLNCVKEYGSENSSTFHIGGAVIAADGYLASKTAALSQPYTDDPASSGQMLSTPNEMEAVAAKILKAGLQLVIHAMGDKAVDMALTKIENVSNLASSKNSRVRLEQAAVLNEKLIERIKKQNVIVSVQPLVVASEFSVWHAMEHLGAERARWLYPLKTLLKNEVRVVGGSDCPMEPLSPLLGIQAAVTRERFSEERVTVDEALRMYTVNAAYSTGEENLKGSIEEDKLADLVVLSRDPTVVPPNEITEINVELAIVNGKNAYSKSH
ncbi:MAG TPA: amidohydrolase [Candidatus Bathyarchaeia archaeon]|nr:amidohydrolase [Candidatus Bathyarchaeia archaeon]